MLDDWHLKCIILQDRNLHDDTVTHCQADAGLGLYSVQQREFYILGNSVKSGGWWLVGPMDHLFLITVSGEALLATGGLQPYH